MARGRNYEKQIKAEAVSLVIDQGKSKAAVAREIEIQKSTVSNWVSQFRDNGTVAFVGSGNLSEKKQSEKNLQKRLRDL